MHSTSTSHRNPHTPHAVDNADWLKTVAIISVSVGHFGYFFVEDDRWWSVFGPGPSRYAGSGSVSS
jgi:peptidoglycan/LPS O-acetylase OafA/YrhL